MIPYVLIFLGAVGEAVLVWILASAVHKRHEVYLQERLTAAEKTITSLVDRIQSPHTQDLVTRQRAQADLEERKALPPMEREKIRQNLLFEEIMEKELWRQHPAFDGIENITKDPSGDGVIIVGKVDPATNLPVIEQVSRMEFCAAFV